jgi:transcriptional regulator with XRE-family HTH domain
LSAKVAASRARNRLLAERLSQSRALSSCTSAQKFAEAVGVALNTVYRIERGDVAPTVQTLRKWAEVCGVSADELLGMAETTAVTPADVNGGA